MVAREHENANELLEFVQVERKAVLIFLFCVVVGLYNDVSENFIIKDGAEDLAC